MATERRTVVVTGASRGFGRALVEDFADDGWQVIAAVRSMPPDPREDVTWVEWDVTHPDSGALVQAVDGAVVDLLVNNAGIGSAQRTLAEIEFDELDKVLQVNLIGVLRTAQALQTNLLASDEPIIVNISSRLASLTDQSAGLYQDLGTSYAYRISKAAQNMASICLANEFGSRVRVIALHPGELATSLGQTGAHTSPDNAARQLKALLTTGSCASPAFLRATGEELHW